MRNGVTMDQIPPAPPKHKTNKVNPPTSINQGTPNHPNPTNNQRNPNHRPDQQPRVRPTATTTTTTTTAAATTTTTTRTTLTTTAQECTRRAPGERQESPRKAAGSPRQPRQPREAPGPPKSPQELQEPKLSSLLKRM